MKEKRGTYTVELQGEGHVDVGGLRGHVCSRSMLPPRAMVMVCDPAATGGWVHGHVTTESHGDVCGLCCHLKPS